MIKNNKNLEKLYKKITAERYRNEVTSAYEIFSNKEKQNDFNQEMVNKTWQYQKKYGFETSPRQGHEFWNNEADAFKHTLGSAEMYFKYGDGLSNVAGIWHEWLTKNNPKNEWNMDSWNNNKGREIAKEILKEYGDRAYKMTDKERSDLIAEKVMQKMRNGELITKPEDIRVYQGKAENIINEIKKRWDGFVTSQAAPVEPFTRQQIGQMTPEEFTQNESTVPYTREDIAGMTTKEFSKNEQSIMAQVKSQGIPSERDLPSGKKSEYSKSQKVQKGSSSKGSKSSSSSSADGKWVTINGNHVLIKE